ncbi:MAG: hypothetical protein JG778_1411 [Thermodesulfobacterium sp.]|nr:hypothetical protein [Thermodesulfobacterium sp.]
MVQMKLEVCKLIFNGEVGLYIPHGSDETRGSLV